LRTPSAGVADGRGAGLEEIALAGWSVSHGAANLAIDGAFGGLPLPPAQARRLARQDAGALVRRVVAGLLRLPEPEMPRRR
jgi:hypothetical protein